ncbi:engulfment and cell motility protein [Anaeramoeba ignava]|uniref:Engulfment and cell motility protein n=1 Tax=Anaeramoeba ignava TaxID=1746090 RepID=A0A9Q0LJ76_ANAIG|nr:engulfment and cell motility protein [Anaeramoeba ignava]
MTTEKTETEPEYIRKIRLQIEPEVHEIVFEQKMVHLIQGAILERVTKTGKYHPKFVKLSENRQEILISDVTKSGQTQTKAAVQVAAKIEELSHVVTGRATINLSKAKKLDDEKILLTFSLIFKDGKKTLDLIASNRNDFVTWVDCFRALLGGKMEEKETLQELKELSDIEVELNLIQRKKKAPPIPPPPRNLNFVNI